MVQATQEGQEGLDHPPDRVEIGSARHKELFCAMLLDTFDPYRPAVIPWPSLSHEAHLRLVNLPFWDMAIETEENAGLRMQAFADSTSDALIQKAVALNAFEERRHKEVLGHMMRFYGIAVSRDIHAKPLRDPRWAFLRTGYGECFDSFFAFGLFELARRAGFFPRELVEVFEPVIQEEARHNLFFVNWVAYTRANLGWSRQPRFLAQRAAALAVQIANRVSAAKGGGGNNFTLEGGEALGLDMNLRSFLQLCLMENERRMTRYDARLLRPRLMPAVARLTIRLLRPSDARG